MGFFRRRRSARRDRAIAEALAQRGVAGRATVVALRPTGATRAEGAREIELTLDVALPGGASVRVVHRQFMSRFTLHGLAPGEPARILYDRDDPATLLVGGHPNLRTDVVDGAIVVVTAEERERPRA